MIDWLITIVAALVVLDRKLLSPEYESVITLAPGGKDAVFNVATPLDRFNVPRSSPVVVSKKSTLPVGVPEPGAFAVTVAVMVTVWPIEPLGIEVVAVVVVASLFTVSVPFL